MPRILAAFLLAFALDRLHALGSGYVPNAVAVGAWGAVAVSILVEAIAHALRVVFPPQVDRPTTRQREIAAAEEARDLRRRSRAQGQHGLVFPPSTPGTDAPRA